MENGGVMVGVGEGSDYGFFFDRYHWPRPWASGGCGGRAQAERTEFLRFRRRHGRRYDILGRSLRRGLCVFRPLGAGQGRGG